MDTTKVDSTSPAGKAAGQSPPQSPARLVLLLVLLAAAVGALAYDYYVAKPGCEAADKKIQEFVEKRNRMGVQEAALVTGADIQKELGKAPTQVRENDAAGYTVEYYCWWGQVPLLNMRRHFIAVVYVGNKPRRYSSHYREEPPAEAYPIVDATPEVPKSTGEPPADSGAEEKPKDKAEKPAEESEKKEDKPKESDKAAEAEKKEGDKSKDGETAKDGDKAK